MISSLTLIATDRCNFRCGYCYRAPRRARTMPADTAAAALDFFLPRSARRCLIDFYGGEPLLAFDVVRAAVGRARELARSHGLRPAFGLTTNGSLIDDGVLGFLDRHRFRVTLSFDGPAQERQRAGTTAAVREALERLLARPRIRLEVNSVFTPASAGLIASSTAALMAMSVPGLRISLDFTRPWGPSARRRLRAELETVRALLVREYARSGRIPVVDYRPAPARGSLVCAGGSRAAAVDPDGYVWGCHLFAEFGRREGGEAFRRRYGFGRLDALAGRWDAAAARLLPRYAALSMDSSTVDGVSCALCPDVVDCGVCPLTPALAGHPPGRIPADVCAIQRLRIRERRLFRASL